MPSRSDDEVAKIVVPATALVELAMGMDLRPHERLEILWDAMAKVLHAYPAHEHAKRLALAMEYACFCAHIDTSVLLTAVPLIPWDDESAAACDARQRASEIFRNAASADHVPPAPARSPIAAATEHLP